MKKGDYKKFLKDNITETYQKSTNSKVNGVDLDAKKIAEKLLISDRVDQLQNHNANITVKDHKESFPHNPLFRLINPSKPDIDRVSRTILDRMNKEIRSSMQVNHRKTSSVVIRWFGNTENKPKLYPSISLSLFN